MGTVPYHRHKAAEFLHRADRAIASRDPTEAASALCRAASHVTTALAVHYGCKHNSRPRLEYALHAAITDDCLARSHLKTFRQTYTLPQRLAALLAHPVPTSPAHPEPVEGRATHPIQSNHPVNSVHRCKSELRRMRRRVSALITHVKAILLGDPKPIRRNKLWQRRPDLADTLDFTHVRDVISLSNFQAIRQRFGLHDISLSAYPDPHDRYARGEQPRPCPCHSHLWRESGPEPSQITLSPLWRKALEKTFRIKLPENHQLAC